MFFKTTFSQTEKAYQERFLNLLKNREILNHKNNSYKGLLKFYKKYISSQDYGSCPYSPSCSVYSHNAVKEHGLFVGFIMSFDRLSRCNRNNENRYEHTKNNKIIDKP